MARLRVASNDPMHAPDRITPSLAWQKQRVLSIYEKPPATRAVVLFLAIRPPGGYLSEIFTSFGSGRLACMHRDRDPPSPSPAATGPGAQRRPGDFCTAKRSSVPRRSARRLSQNKVRKCAPPGFPGTSAPQSPKVCPGPGSPGFAPGFFLFAPGFLPPEKGFLIAPCELSETTRKLRRKLS